MTDCRIRFDETGGPEVLKTEAVDLSSPGPGEVRLRHDVIGLNFIDIYHRSGLYPVPLPSGIGTEAAGTIDAIGPDVGDFRPGDRVAYATAPLGAYATARILPARFLVPVPDDIASETAAAALLKGMTAEFLIERCARVQPGQTALVHASAGGVGSILIQWLKAIGVRVLAHAGDETKAAIVRALGIAEVSCAPMDELARWTRDSTGGHGADVIFDGVGAASWAASLAAVAKRGLIISFGNASGPVPAFTMLDILRAGSVFITRPTLFDYCGTAEDTRASATRLFAMIRSGAVSVKIGQRFALREAADAQRALVERRTTGSTILLP